jgi:hypothetical protein
LTQRGLQLAEGLPRGGELGGEIGHSLCVAAQLAAELDLEIANLCLKTTRVQGTAQRAETGTLLVKTPLQSRGALIRR